MRQRQAIIDTALSKKFDHFDKGVDQYISHFDLLVSYLYFTEGSFILIRNVKHCMSLSLSRALSLPGKQLFDFYKLKHRITSLTVFLSMSIKCKYWYRNKYI